jgi:hypothetical protein
MNSHVIIMMINQQNAQLEALISLEVEQLAKNESEVNEELWNKQAWRATT